MKVSVEPVDPSTVPRGADLHLVTDDREIARFAAAVNTGHMRTGGEMTVTLIVPFEQVPNVVPVMQYVGGVLFEITVRRVPREQLPESGWNNGNG